MGWGYGTTWLWDIILIAFWIAVVVGIIFLIRWLILSTRTGSQTPAHGNSALEVLKVRYARGEINKSEFEQIKKDLLA
jgi:putative membrane protein